MGPKNALAKVKNKIKKTVDSKEQAYKDSLRLKVWKERLTQSLSAHENFRNMAAEWDSQYNGTNEISPLSGGGYMSDKDMRQTKNARQVVNITYQLIESAIAIDIPKPSVQQIEDAEDMERQKMIEGSIEYISQSSDIQKIVSENERITKKNSLSVFKISYDPSFDGHTYKGKIKTTNPHPCNIIPQAGQFRIEDMDYLFQVETRTIDYLCRTYGEKFRDLLEGESAPYAYLDYFDEQIAPTSTQGKVSIVEAWYKDKDGDICLLTWCNEYILKDEPKFFYKRDLEGNITEKEVVDIQIPNPDGSVGVQTVEVQCKVPKTFPFIVWYNVPLEKSYYAKSDCDIIKDQQESIKKLLSIEEEKHMKGTTKIFTRTGTGLERKITNATSQIIETDDPNNDVKVVDLKTPDNSMIELYQLYVQAAKDALGITEASQGRSEGANLSGKALDLLSQNTQGRLMTKQFEKNIAFANLYKMYFNFMLAFYDDPVPYRVEGADKPEFGYFDKSKLIKQDDAGEWYYPDFDIFISADTGLPKDKNFIINTATQALQTGAIDAVDYWYILDSTGFPNAEFILDRAKEKEQQQQQLQQQQMDMQQQQMQMQQNQQSIAAQSQMAQQQQKSDQMAMQQQQSQQQAAADQQQQEIDNASAAQQMQMQQEQHNMSIQQQQKELDGKDVPNAKDILAVVSKLSPQMKKKFMEGSAEEQLKIYLKATGQTGK